MAEVEAQVFFYTVAERLEEEKVETLALTLAEVKAKDFFEKITNIKATVKVKTLPNKLGNMELKR